MDVDAKKLVHLIEARSPIYNYRNKEHTNKIIIEKLWSQIAAEMNCSVSECKTKWTNLRNSYSRYLREDKTKQSESSGKQRKKWYMADDMSFVKDYINHHRNTSTHLDSSDADDIKEVISEVDYLVTLKESTQSHTSTARDSPEPSKRIRTLVSNMTTLNENTQSNTSTARDSPVPSKRSRTFVTDVVAGPMIEFLESRTKNKLSENSNSLFFKSLLADYEKLSGRRQRSFRAHMLNNMNELQEEEENDAVNVSNDLSTEAMSDAGHQQQQEHTSSFNTPFASCTPMQEFSIIEIKKEPDE